MPAVDSQTRETARIRVPGRFWDSFLYKGQLYLFCRDGSIQTLEWDSIPDILRIDNDLKLVFAASFTQSDLFYGMTYKRFIDDEDIKGLLIEKFMKLQNLSLHLTEAQVEVATASRQDNRFPCPHADCDVYMDLLYVGSRDGVHSARCGTRTVKSVSSRVTKHWDAPVLALEASWSSLAAALGDDGLYELTVGRQSCANSKPRMVAEQHCSSCNWMYHSIYGSSYETGGFLSFFTKDVGSDRAAPPERRFERNVSSDDIFGSSGFSWGVQDKLCQSTSEGIAVRRYNPWRADPAERIIDLGVISVSPANGSIIDASVASFGTVLEYDERLGVVLSDETLISLTGEPVRWRVFPRSKHYQNQLHVVYDDYLEVISFNRDFLVDQSCKRSGTQVFSRTLRH